MQAAWATGLEGTASLPAAQQPKCVPDLAFNGQDYAVPVYLVTDKTAFLLKDLILPMTQKSSIDF